MKKSLFLFTYLVVFYFFTSSFSSETNIISFSEKSLLEEEYKKLPPKKQFIARFENEQREKNKKLPPKKQFIARFENEQQKRKKNTGINNQVKNKIILEKSEEQITSLPSLIQPEDNFFQKYSRKNINSSEKSVKSLKRGSSNGKGSNKKRKIGLKGKNFNNKKSSKKIYVNYKELIGIVKKTLGLSKETINYNKELRKKILSLPGVNLNEEDKPRYLRIKNEQNRVSWLIANKFKPFSSVDELYFVNYEFPDPKSRKRMTNEKNFVHYLLYLYKIKDPSLDGFNPYNLRFEDK